MFYYQSYTFFLIFWKTFWFVQRHVFLLFFFARRNWQFVHSRLKLLTESKLQRFFILIKIQHLFSTPAQSLNSLRNPKPRSKFMIWLFFWRKEKKSWKSKKKKKTYNSQTSPIIPIPITCRRKSQRTNDEKIQASLSSQAIFTSLFSTRAQHTYYIQLSFVPCSSNDSSLYFPLTVVVARLRLLI